ncbi:acylglycerol kinase, mitochondrial [Copidosoma floridanum]|uniref:acylglycerol kinase, mitochondrial n=1 Tax=Copidosoma floridanum TaxID=29053 RepID=UPI0006C99B6E|nr:acylglycerol kinase, mitochondrial [Copidosoma floridanum]
MITGKQGTPEETQEFAAVQITPIVQLQAERRLQPSRRRESELSTEPIYAVGTVEWGAWKDAYARMDKYWYWGSLRRYATYIFNGYKKDINWSCSGIIRYLNPCYGCSRCYVDNKEIISLKKRWWNMFVPKVNTYLADQKDVKYSNVINENCGIIHEATISTVELNISTRNINLSKDILTPAAKIEFGPENIDYFHFVKEGWQRVEGKKKLISNALEAKEIEIYPTKLDDSAVNERSFYIDNEEFELNINQFLCKELPYALKFSFYLTRISWVLASINVPYAKSGIGVMNS